MLVGVALGAFLSAWQARRAERARRRIPARWPLNPRVIVNSEERRVWRWLCRAFVDHHIMVKMPVTRFTMPRSPDNSVHWFNLLNGAYCTFTVCTPEGRAVGCVDVPGPKGLSRRNQQLKHSLLTQCGIAYWLIRSNDLPTLTEIRLEFLDPAEPGQLFPAGNPADSLSVPGVGAFPATLIDAGNPTIFIHAGVLGLKGTELPAAINRDADLLARAERIRAVGAMAMGLAGSVEEAGALRPHTPKLALVSPPADYVASDGRPVSREAIDLVARIFSMGQLHHAMTGTGAVALAAAAAIPGTVVHDVAASVSRGQLCFGHPSGSLRVGAETRQVDGRWVIDRVIMSRSARILMEGWVRIPPYS